MPVTGTIHHIEIYTADLAKKRSFWEWFLCEINYTLFQEWDEGFSMKHGDSYIVFVQAEKRFCDVLYHRCRPGLNHLAFHADSQETVDLITEKLKNKGVPILYEDRHPYAGGQGYYAVFFEDPDRMKVELTAP